MIAIVRFICRVSALSVLPLFTLAQTETSAHLTTTNLIERSNHKEVAYDSVVEHYRFSGLAAYYNHPIFTLFVAARYTRWMRGSNTYYRAKTGLLRQDGTVPLHFLILMAR